MFRLREKEILPSDWILGGIIILSLVIILASAALAVFSSFQYIVEEFSKFLGR